MKEFISITCLLLATSLNAVNLFEFNFQKINPLNKCNISKEMQFYRNNLNNQSNYLPVAKLNDWVDPDYTYPNIHPYHKLIVDTIDSLNVQSVCDVGAGCGKVAKYVYANNPNIDLTCVEHCNKHLQQINENFNTNTGVILPNIKVNAQVKKGAVPYLDQFEDNTFDLVYTCTVMMHIPYIPAILAAKELSRITSGYVLHVENKNKGPNWYDKVIIKPSKMSKYNFLAIDYKSVYEALGFETIKYYEFKDPNTPATYIYYLGKKV